MSNKFSTITLIKFRYIKQEIDDLLAGGAGVEQPDDDELLAELGEILGADVSLASNVNLESRLIRLNIWFKPN